MHRQRSRVIYTRGEHCTRLPAAELNQTGIREWQSIVGSCSCGGDGPCVAHVPDLLAVISGGTPVLRTKSEGQVRGVKGDISRHALHPNGW